MRTNWNWIGGASVVVGLLNGCILLGEKAWPWAQNLPFRPAVVAWGAAGVALLAFAVGWKQRLHATRTQAERDESAYEHRGPLYANEVGREEDEADSPDAESR